MAARNLPNRYTHPQACINALEEERDELRGALREAEVDRDGNSNQLDEYRRTLRDILKAWGLGDTDKMEVLMLSAFLGEFGRAPHPDVAKRENV
jgi:hypothetical protein